MMKQKHFCILGIMAFLGIIFISGCIKQPIGEITEKGFLQGRVTIGPLCPLEKNLSGSGCQPTEETYKDWPIIVYTPDKKIKIAQINPALNGTYKIELPVGNYVIDLEGRYRFGRNLPANVIIKKGKTTTLNINIDTGIR